MQHDVLYLAGQEPRSKSSCGIKMHSSSLMEDISRIHLLNKQRCNSSLRFEQTLAHKRETPCTKTNRESKILISRLGIMSFPARHLVFPCHSCHHHSVASCIKSRKEYETLSKIDWRAYHDSAELAIRQPCAKVRKRTFLSINKRLPVDLSNKTLATSCLVLNAEVEHETP